MSTLGVEGRKESLSSNGEEVPVSFTLISVGERAAEGAGDAKAERELWWAGTGLSWGPVGWEARWVWGEPLNVWVAVCVHVPVC